MTQSKHSSSIQSSVNENSLPEADQYSLDHTGSEYNEPEVTNWIESRVSDSQVCLDFEANRTIILDKEYFSLKLLHPINQQDFLVVVDVYESPMTSSLPKTMTSQTMTLPMTRPITSSSATEVSDLQNTTIPTWLQNELDQATVIPTTENQPNQYQIPVSLRVEREGTIQTILTLKPPTVSEKGPSLSKTAGLSKQLVDNEKTEVQYFPDNRHSWTMMENQLKKSRQENQELRRVILYSLPYGDFQTRRLNITLSRLHLTGIKRILTPIRSKLAEYEELMAQQRSKNSSKNSKICSFM